MCTKLCHFDRTNLMEADDPMSQRLRLTLSLAVLAWMCVSCQVPAEGLSSVSGKVFCDGEPAAGAVLLFYRQAGGEPVSPGVAQVVPTAVVQHDGSFTVESVHRGSGASPGSYAVLAQWPNEQEVGNAGVTDKSEATSIRGKKVVVSKHNKHDSAAPDRLKGRYMDMRKPLLKTEVKPGPNDLGTLDLSLNN
jgi:hypothetical protein